MEASQDEEEQASFDSAYGVRNAANNEVLQGNVANAALDHNILLRDGGDDD